MTLDGFWIQGRMLRASFGTTKYCNFFLRGQKCTNPDCLYLHALGSDSDSFTKEEMQSSSFFQEQTHPGKGPQPQKQYDGSTLFPPAIKSEKIIEDDTDAVEYGVRGMDDVTDSDSDNDNNKNEINWLNDDKYDDPNKDDPNCGWGFSAYNICSKYLNDLAQEYEEKDDNLEEAKIYAQPIDLSGLDDYILPPYNNIMQVSPTEEEVYNYLLLVFNQCILHKQMHHQ